MVNARQADDLLRSAETFVSVVELALGLAHPNLLDELVPEPLSLFVVPAVGFLDIPGCFGEEDQSVSHRAA